MMKFFVKDFYKTMQARVDIFGKQVDNDVLHLGIANQPSLVIFVMQVDNNELYCEIAN